jgi:Fe-S-cluster containining protein
MPAIFDCKSCGACCCNTARNLRDNHREYVEITKKDKLFRERELLEQVGVKNARGELHMILVGPEQRCIALDGDIGEGVKCTIYAWRPQGCKNVEAGDDECLKARKSKGMSPEGVL